VAKRRAPAGRGGRRPRRGVRKTPDVRLSTRYIESSALVAALLERDVAARASIRAQGKRVTSALTVAEAARAILRGRATGRLSEADERDATRGLQVFARRCDLVSVTDAVLARVGRPFPLEPIRTLDALHLATAEELAEPPALVTIVTRDARVRDNARALGYAVE
jgi:predicted nucleic acid-binding protein